MLKLAGLEQRPDGRFFSSPEDEPDTDSHSYLLHIWTSPSTMWLFFIVISCCCMRVSGRVFTDDAVVIAHFRWGPTLLAHAGGGKVPADPMPPAVLCGPGGEGGAQQWGWGWTAASAALYSGVQGMCLTLSFQGISFLCGKFRQSQRTQRWKRAVPIIIALDSSICAVMRLTLIYSTIPLGTSKYLSFSFTYIYARQTHPASAVK